MDKQEFAAAVGKRVHAYRMSQGISQEKLGERAGLHATYIGQIERGQKNITLNSLRRILISLEVSLAEFFSSFDDGRASADDPPHACYDLVASRPPREQEAICNILYEVVNMVDGGDES